MSPFFHVMISFSRLILRRGALPAWVGLLALVGGCKDDSATVRQIQSQRQVRMQSEAQQDHLGEVYGLLERFVELNSEKSRRQIAYHLNRWSEANRGSASPESSAKSDALAPATIELLKTVSNLIPLETSKDQVSRTEFIANDVNHFRDAYIFTRVAEWVDRESSDDPLLEDWFDELVKTKSPESVARLRTASRLFDWVIRNIAFEPLEPNDPAPPGPSFPAGMVFRGAGYRASNYETLWHGSGDAWQRAGVFTQLCRQASIPAAVLAVAAGDTGTLRPWCVGVLVDNEVYLFEPGLGCFIPGPDQVGIATLAQARTDASIVRRLNVAGFFEDYPFSKNDIQQCIALLNLMPETLSPRMQRVEQGMTGDRRMSLYVDAASLAEQLDAASGIAGVRLWEIPLLAEVYRVTLQQAAERDPMLAFWYWSRWAIIDAQTDLSTQLARGRWAHLQGQFDDGDEGLTQGARGLYLEQRAPEFEIEDLRIDVELQKQYGIRRDLGISPEVYDRQVQQIQGMMRLGKRTATYWLSLVQYDDGRFETAENWFNARVLTDEQRSFWEPAARYNLARCLERLNEIPRAIEIYKTNGDPQEHGNRIRARLLDRTSSSDTSAGETNAEDKTTSDTTNGEPAPVKEEPASE